MHQTDSKNHFQKAVYHFYRKAGNLNLYIQNITPFDRVRVRKELAELAVQLNELTQEINQKTRGG